MKLIDLLKQLKTSTIVTILTIRRDYYVYRKSISYILDEKDKDKYLKLEINEDILFIKDYGFIIRVKDGLLKNEN